jgi:hypothetical protein
MRKYDEPVEVRRGMVSGPGGRQEGPEQFLWRGRLWKVCDVVAHWVETGPWWQSSGVAAVLGADAPPQPGSSRAGGTAGGAGGMAGTAAGMAGTTAVAAPAAPVDLAAEREVWRVEAARGLAAAGSGRGVFDLVLDWTDGSWQLAGCVD